MSKRLDDPLIVNPTKSRLTFTRKSKPREKAITITTKVARLDDVENLQLERGMLYPGMRVYDFLVRVKGYTPNQYKEFMRLVPGADWDKVRDETQSKITARVAERHVDLIAESEDLFLRTAKIGITRIVEMLTKLKISDIPEFVVIADPRTGNKKTYKKLHLRSVDIANCMAALENGMKIYRSALGLSEEGEGLKYVMDQLRDLLAGSGVNLTQITVNQGPKPINLGQEKISDIAENDYDRLFQLIEMKRGINELKIINESDSKTEEKKEVHYDA